MMSRISRDLAAHHAHSASRFRSISSQRSANQMMPRVAVIGAGLAGLRCADVLLRNGAEVTIYEARNRIGGRVLQHVDGDKCFDMGPNWIHGTEGNPMMKLAEKTGTTILEPEERQLVFDSTGQKKSAQEAMELGADTWAMVVDAFKHSNEHCTEIDPQASLLDFFNDELTKRFPDDENQLRERINEARMWGPFVGDPIDRQSLRNFFLEQCLEGENVIVASTYKDILKEVAMVAQQKADLRFNEEVVKIEYRESDDSTSRIIVTNARAEQSVFDEVIVTCPLGWLKSHMKDAFAPTLPARLTQAIGNISYGHLEKIYVTFPLAWWMGEISNKALNGTSTSHRQELPDEQGTPIFIHFHHPSYHPDPASNKTKFWNQAVVSLAHFPGATALPTLLFYMYGPCSLYMTSSIGALEPGSKAYNAFLYDFVEPFISRLPFYSAEEPACTPTSFVATQWSNDPYAGNGSYSNFQVGLVQGDEDIKCMRDAGGLSDAGRGLWFAGEHTAPFVAIGTTTGAYWSGEAVARRVLNRYGVESVKTGDEESNGFVKEGVRKEINGEVMDGTNLTGLAM